MPDAAPWAALIERLRKFTGGHEQVEAAIALAIAAHKDATRDEGTPYVLHPLRVALILVEELGICDPNMIMAALLHDVLEDNDAVQPQHIALTCGPEVRDMVVALTRRTAASDAQGPESRAAYLRRFSAAPEPVLVLKLCDRLDNLRSLPRSPSAVKRRRYLQETTDCLLPLCEGRGGPVHTLGQLMLLAIDIITATEARVAPDEHPNRSTP